MAKQIAPRLANGQTRDTYGGRLPPAIRAALRVIARDERQSVSWVMEQVIIDYFQMKTPMYKQQARRLKTRRG